MSGVEIVVYGPAARVSELDLRSRGEDGDRAHADATREHLERISGERQQAGR